MLYLGRVIEEQKRIRLMARIMQATLEAGINLEWTIAGDGQDLGYLRNQFAASGSKVRFLGAVPYGEVPQVLAQHDVYFLCSDYEGLPLSLLEAMGAGLVPVVSDLPSGISEVVNDANGIRVAVADEGGYVRALTGLAVRCPAPRRTFASRTNGRDSKPFHGCHGAALGCDAGTTSPGLRAGVAAKLHGNRPAAR